MDKYHALFWVLIFKKHEQIYERKVNKNHIK